MSVLASTVGLIFVKETTPYESGLPGLFLHETALALSAGRMDGQAQVSALSINKIGAAEMDGQAQVSAYSVTMSRGAARMDGQAQVSTSSVNMAVGAAQMDGRTLMVVGQSVPGAGLTEITGVASMAAVSPHIYNINIFQNLIGSDATSILTRYKPNLLEHLIGGEIIKVSSLYKLALLNTINLTGTRSYTMKFTEVLREIAITLIASPTAHSHYRYIFTDPINVAPMLALARTAVLGLVQNLAMSQITSQKFIWGRILDEVFKISAAVAAVGTYKKILTQLFKLSDIGGLSHRIAVALSQGINLSLSLAGGFSLKLLQKFLVATTSSSVFHYHLALAGRVVVKDIIGHFASAIITQLFTVHPALNRQFVASNSLAQLLTIHSALNNKLILKITGNLQLSPSQLVKMLYKGDPLLDGVVITALYISPSGTTTTWAVNTRTNAVTEYLNYDFQSFALMGNRYIAAGDGGLYELDGDTDDGALIISEMMSGYLQLNEKKLFGIKGAYVAIRGGGRFYLKLISGDGREYVYELKAQPNLMTTKVKIGKGLRTTYMAFNLVTEGQDWDLDSVEFIPMVSGRRV